MLSDVLGLVGAVILPIPWFMDFFIKRRRSRIIDLSKYRPDETTIDLLNRITAERLEEFLTPDWRQLLLSLLGIGLIAAAFLVKLLSSPPFVVAVPSAG